MQKIYIFKSLIILLLCSYGHVSAQQTATIKKQLGITIDGVGDETAWENAESHLITNYLSGTVDDEFDFSASFKLAWNDTALFYLVEANDFDIIPADAWNADGFEMYFKFGNGTAIPPNIGGDRENGIFQVAVRLTNEPATGGYMPDSTRNDAVTIINTNEDGWVTEGYAAWGQFNNENGDPIVPSESYTFRFDMNVQDNDPDQDLVRGYWSSNAHLWDQDISFATAGVVTLSSDILDPQVGVRKNVAESISVFPNPVKDVMNISGKVNSISVYDVVGKKVLSESNLDKGQVSLKSLQEGVYIVNFFNNGDYMGSQKIFKIK